MLIWIYENNMKTIPRAVLPNSPWKIVSIPWPVRTFVKLIKKCITNYVIISHSRGIVVRTLSIDCAKNLIIPWTAFFVVLGMVINSWCDAVSSLPVLLTTQFIPDVNNPWCKQKFVHVIWLRKIHFAQTVPYKLCNNWSIFVQFDDSSFGIMRKSIKW